MAIDQAALERALRQVAGERIQALTAAAGVATAIVDVGGLAPAARDTLEAELRAVAAGVPGTADPAAFRLVLTAERGAAPVAPAPSAGPVLIAVGSGKGGVGKSTLAANLAVALVRGGRRVGLVDADIYGPSQPTLLGIEGQRPEAAGKKLVPVPSPSGVALLSLGQLVRPDQAVAWRGPMAGNALGQLIDAEWGETEIVVVDLPPGTGDVQLTMLQKHKPRGAVIVSTPQDLALIDARRAINLFEQGGVPIIGLVENMAGYACPHCGEISDPFGNGGAEAAAARLGLAFLGRIPLTIAIRTASDAGTPPAGGTGPEADAFAALARAVSGWLDAH